MAEAYLTCKEAVSGQEQTSRQHLRSRCSVPPPGCSEVGLLTASRVQNPKTTLSNMQCSVPCDMLVVKCRMRACNKQVLRMQGVIQIKLMEL